MLTLVFLRHGLKPGNGEDRLTGIGYRQVHSTAIRLRDELDLWPDEILHSPEQESLQSAGIINRTYEGTWKGWWRSCWNDVQVKQSNSLRTGMRDAFTRNALQELNPQHETVFCVAGSDIIRSQFSFLHPEFSYFDVERKLCHGAALVMHFDEVKWSDMDRRTEPVEYRLIKPEL